MSRIGVGIIGVNSTRGWAASAHIPALRSLPARYEIRALSTTREESARQAALSFGVERAFSSSTALIEDPSVDLVVVTVKVPEHHRLVRAAIEAGKHVYCEWPLGKTAGEAAEMSELASTGPLHAAVGLQARMSPEIGYLRELVTGGYVGRVLSTSVIASARSWGPIVEQPSVYLLDRGNGATMLSIPFGHTVDALCLVLGEFCDITAMLAHGRDHAIHADTGASVPMTTHDQVAVAGVLEGGALASMHFRGGLSCGNNFLWEINGDEGDLVVTAGAGHIQMMDLTIQGARKGSGGLKTMVPPAAREDAAIATPPGPARNVARLYAALAADIRDGTRRAPGFVVALARHRMLEAVERAAERGKRQALSIADAVWCDWRAAAEAD
jgi:predicted dehydrogenase